MLQLQAQALEQQERVYKNQIRLNIREILQGELNFYNQVRTALDRILVTTTVACGSTTVATPFRGRRWQISAPQLRSWVASV